MQADPRVVLEVRDVVGEEPLPEDGLQRRGVGTGIQGIERLDRPCGDELFDDRKQPLRRLDILPRLKPWDSSAWVIQAVPVPPEARFPSRVLRSAGSSLVD